MSFSSMLLMVLAVCSAFAAETRLDTLACGTHTMNPGERVVIQSPGFPATYPNSNRCQYEITCNTRGTTYLQFICPTFSLEASAGCTNDRLIVTSLGSTATKCGTNSPDGTVTADGWTRVTFASNSVKTAPGFRCYIWCRAKATTTTTTTSTTTTTIPTTTTTTPPTTTTTAAPTTPAPTTPAPTTAAPTTADPTTAAP